VFSDSNRVLGYVGNNSLRHQFDPEVDNVETREQAALVQPVEITARRFIREGGRGIQGTLGFAVLDLFENNVAIMRYLETHWDQLSTTAPHQRRSQMWILAKRDTDCPYGTANHVRAAPFDDLVQLTAMELGVPVDDVPLHIDLRALYVLSRYGPPANFPAPVGATGRTHAAQGYSSPIRQAMVACIYLTGIADRAPNSIPPPPPTPDAGSEGPHPSSSSSGTTSVENVRSGTRIPGRAGGEGLGQGPTDTPPPTDRRSCLATAPARFNTGTEWKKYCTPPRSSGANRMLVRIRATQLAPGKQGVGNAGEHAAVTLCGTPALLYDVLKLWTSHTTTSVNLQVSAEHG
jgi:hypothetical protein